MKSVFPRRLLSAAITGSLLLAAPLFPTLAQAPAWQWASSTNSTASGAIDMSRAERSATDAAGDVYVTGMFKGTVTFGAAGTLVSSIGTSDIFIAKLNGATGAWMWVTQGAGFGDDSGYGVATDNAGNVYATGRFENGLVQFAPLGPLAGSGGYDVFVVKLNATTGVPIANVSGGGTGLDVGRSIAYHAGSNSLYVTGEYTSGTAVIGAPLTNAGAGTADIFVAQLAAGALAWTGASVTVGGPADDVARGVAVSLAGEVFITGGYASPVIVFGATPPLVNSGGFSTSGGPNPDIFVAKSSPGLGAWLWSETAGGVGRDMGQDVSINATGHVIATGGFERAPASFGAIPFPLTTSGIDAYVARLNPAVGTWQWVQQGGGLTDDSGFAINHDAGGNIYVTGAFRSFTATFGTTVLTNFAPSGINADVFVSKLTNAGTWTWTQQAGGLRDETGRGLAVSSVAGVFVSGEYTSVPAVFNPFPLAPGVIQEAFVARIPGTLNNLVITTPTVIPCGGAYNNITVQSGGVAMPCGPLYVTGNVIVLGGGTWTSNCSFPLTGPGNFALNAGALLNICSPQGIELVGPVGDIQVTGTRTFSPSGDYAYVNASVAQATGLGLSGARDLTIVTPGGANLTQSIFVRRLLRFTPAGGNLTLGGNGLAMLSILSQTAMIINPSPVVGVVGPNGRHERIVDGTFRPGLGYRHLSSPMINAVVSTLTCPGYTAIVNPAFDAQFNPLPVPFPTVYGYNETLKPGFPNFAYGYFSPATPGTALVPGIAVSATMTGNRKPTFRGQFQNGNVTVGPLTLTGPWTGPGDKSGWHMLGNPYPSPINWSGAAVPAGMSPIIYYWRAMNPTASSGMYLSYDATLPGPQLLPVGQGFFARVTAAGPSFTFTNAMRPTSFISPSYYSRPAPGPRPEARLTLRAVGAAPGYEDQTRISFAIGAATTATDALDSERPGHNVDVPTLLSLASDGTELGHNLLPETDLYAGLSVPLLLDLPTAGAYELTADVLNDLAGSDVTLLDRLTGTRYDLRVQPTVTFTATQAGVDRTRFTLVFGQRVTGLSADAAATALSLAPNPARGTVRVTLPAGATQRVQLLDATGRVVRAVSLEPGASTLDLRGLPAGVYVVRAGAATQRLVVE